MDEVRTARARRWLVILFGMLGVSNASWLARLPSVRDQLGVSTGTLGTVLVAGSVGSLVTVMFAGRYVQRVGGKRVVQVSAVMFLISSALAGIGPREGSLLLVGLGSLGSGASFALLNVVLNVESASVERRMRRTVIPQFHAAYSIGAVVGSLVGSAAARWGVSVMVQVLLVTVLVSGLRWVGSYLVVLDTVPGGASQPADGTRADGTPAGDTLAADMHDADIPVAVVPDVAASGTAIALDRTDGTALTEAAGPAEPASTGETTDPTAANPATGRPWTPWRERRTLLIGVIITASGLSEGAANDWLSIAVVDGFGQSEAVGAAVFGLFIASMTALRLLGTRLIDRLGRTVILRTSALTAAAGLLLFGYAPYEPVAIAGVVAWGMGAALAIPIGIAAASDDPRRAALRVAVVSAFSATAYLVAPPALGFLAQAIGARHALSVIVVALVTSAILAPNAEREVPAPARREVVPA